MAFDWISNLFQSEQTRGLSGESASAVALDDANPYYNYRLRMHRAEGDIVVDPGLLWFTSPYVKQRTGLGTHIGSELGDGTANFTDVLLILSQADYTRAVNQPHEPWLQTATRVLVEEFESFANRENFQRRFAHRQLGFRILCDGSADMGGQSLGLAAGDFVTGLLPNLYTGPVQGSRPIIGVHVNVPGVWDGYQEVGRLYADQILFTLGNHWLDNFSHPYLREAALYRLQQYPDGRPVHIINPDLQDRYQVTSTDQGGASVLTLATRDGQPLAYMVLAVIDTPLEPVPVLRRAGSSPGISMPELQAPTSDEPDEPDMAPPMLLDDDDGVENLSEARHMPEIDRSERPAGGMSKTIIPDAPSERIFTLQERGALLQKVHFSAFMEGYDVFLGTRGELGTVVDEIAATFEVRKRSVNILAHVDGVEVGGRTLAVGERAEINGHTEIYVGGQRLDYRDLRGTKVDGWPYVGEIRRAASSTYMIWGQDYRVGRSRECRVVLPDEPRNDNIRWKASVGDGATIRARTGEIRKDNFYTDSIMVASEHASISLSEEAPVVHSMARHCYVYVRRSGELIALYPTTLGREPQQLPCEPGDEILIGNCLFHVGFTPAGEAVHVAPAPRVELSADSLADAVSEPNLSQLEAPSQPEHGGVDLPPAVGLGERGLAPQPVPLEQVGMDSILGTASFDDDDDHLAPIADEEPTERLPKLDWSDNSEGWDDGADRSGFESDDDWSPAPEPEDEVSDSSTSTWDEGDQDSYDDDGDLPGIGESTDPGATFEPEALPAPPPPPAPELDPLPSVEESVEEEAPSPPADDEPPPPPAEEPPSPAADEPPPPPAEEPPSPAADEPPPPSPAADEPPPPPPAEEPPPPPAAEEPPPPPAEEPPPPPPAEEPPPPPAAEEPPPPPAEEPPPPPPAEEPPPPPAEEPPPPPAAEESPPPPPAAEESPPPPAANVSTVVAVDDEDAQFELGREVQLVHSGWMINGEAVCGNHTGAGMILPESRLVADQHFECVDYFRIQIRGRRGKVEVLAPSELLVDEDDPKAEVYTHLDEMTLDVIRRDDLGEEDFAIRIEILHDRKLPDPRARFVALDYEDPLAAALLSKGLPRGTDRRLTLSGISLTLHWNGERVRVSDYLDTYRRDGGFAPFFVQRGTKRFTTAPEDGAAFEIEVDDRLVVGNVIYILHSE